MIYTCRLYHTLLDVFVVQIIIEKAQNEKNLAELDKSKFLVPEELTMSQLVNIIRYSITLATAAQLLVTHNIPYPYH